MTHLQHSIHQLERKTLFFPLLSFIIPLMVRMIPEILMGPYVTGFDTIGFYVPNTLNWLQNGVNPSTYLATAPLFYTIFLPIVAVGASPIMVLKILSPLLLGALGFSIYLYAKNGLRWSTAKSLFIAFLGTLYFVALRASWDQLREELGLIFLFFALIVLANSRTGSWKRYTLLSLILVMVVLSHQLVSVILLGMIVFTILNQYIRKDDKSLKLIVASIPASILFLVIVYLNDITQAGFQNYSTNIVSSLASWTGFTSYASMLMAEGGFLLYCYIPLLPIVLISLKHFENPQLRGWLVLSLILLLIPTAFVSPYRWLLILSYPLSFYAVESISILKSHTWKKVKFPFHRIAVLYLVLSTCVLSCGFIFMNPQHPFVYFNPEHANGYVYQIPTSMQQNTLSKIDCQDTEKAFQWFKENTNSTAVMLTHTVFYGWALLNLQENPVIPYGFEEPDQTATLAIQDGYKEIYVIWWINGKGWYAQPSLSSSFVEVYRTGEIAIYHYLPIS
ncbi:TPA: hypothetical protein ENS27_11605 [bacterium]|nr:hypothetical protein [bacterium]